MHFSQAASTLSLAAMAFSGVAYAMPVDKRSEAAWDPSWSAAWFLPAETSAVAAAPTASSNAQPFNFPLSNQFPNIVNPSQQLTDIQNEAHGTLSNAPPPASLSADTLTSLRLVAFNEIFEVAFFTSLIQNITQGVAGYTFSDPAQKQIILDELVAVQAQEELHALNANGALKKFNAGPIQACKYKFPTADFRSAISLASTFTDVVLGTLQDVIGDAAVAGDAGFTRGVASVIGQEGEQNGFYRTLLGKLPSALPFLTASTRQFAFSALNQNFIVPGSCPNVNTINLPIFASLTLNTQNIQPFDQNLSFNVDIGSLNLQSSFAGLSLVFINQQNLPIVQPLMNPTSADGKTATFQVNFPYSENLMNGLTIAALVKGSGPFANADAVANATIAGPALIEIN